MTPASFLVAQPPLKNKQSGCYIWGGCVYTELQTPHILFCIVSFSSSYFVQRDRLEKFPTIYRLLRSYKSVCFCLRECAQTHTVWFAEIQILVSNCLEYKWRFPLNWALFSGHTVLFVGAILVELTVVA